MLVPMRALFLKVLLSVISTLIFLIIVELVCRIFYHPEKKSIEGVFEYSSEKVFALKKSFTGIFEDKQVVTNSYGYRDVEIPLEKDSDEVRVLIVGDSVSFGHSVNVEDTYANKLEIMLRKQYPVQKIEVINTAAPGNSTMEEYYDLKNGIKFHPDIVLIQFCPNDIGEPFSFRQELGGEGLDYHKVQEASFANYYLTQHSAFYLLLLDIRNQLTFGTTDVSKIKDQAKKSESAAVFDLVNGPSNENTHKAWTIYFKWLGKMLSICQANHIKCYVVESPFIQQIDFADGYLFPGQADIQTFSQKRNVESINLVPYFQQNLLTTLKSTQRTASDAAFINVQESLPNEVEQYKKHLFLDGDHYTPEGHLEVAKILFNILKDLPEFVGHR